jgi:hypothetical protein
VSTTISWEHDVCWVYTITALSLSLSNSVSPHKSYWFNLLSVYQICLSVGNVLLSPSLLLSSLPSTTVRTCTYFLQLCLTHSSPHQNEAITSRTFLIMPSHYAYILGTSIPLRSTAQPCLVFSSPQGPPPPHLWCSPCS